MKTSFYVALLCLFGVANYPKGFSQKKETKDTTIVNVGKKRIIIVNKSNLEDADEPEDSGTDSTAERFNYKVMVSDVYSGLIEDLQQANSELEEQIQQSNNPAVQDALRKAQKKIQQQIEKLQEKNTTQSNNDKSGKKSTDDDDESDYHENHPKKQRPEIVIGGISLGLNMLLFNNSFDYPESYKDMELRTGKSIHVRLSPVGLHLPLGRGFNFQTDCSFDWNNYRFVNNIRLKSMDNRLLIFPDSTSLVKNKLVATWVGLPVMFGWESNKGKDGGNRFRIGIGWYTGYLISAYTKQVTKENGTIKNRENFGINRIAYGPKFRIGYGLFNIYAQYMLSNFLLKESSNNINFGIDFTGF
ncbi:MAG: PorT family protein [Bacteroidia bacterium]|nr:PorT family protein [Bacteroidia bacterium]